MAITGPIPLPNIGEKIGGLGDALAQGVQQYKQQQFLRQLLGLDQPQQQQQQQAPAQQGTGAMADYGAIINGLKGMNSNAQIPMANQPQQQGNPGYPGNPQQNMGQSDPYASVKRAIYKKIYGIDPYEETPGQKRQNDIQQDAIKEQNKLNIASQHQADLSVPKLEQELSNLYKIKWLAERDQPGGKGLEEPLFENNIPFIGDSWYSSHTDNPSSGIFDQISGDIVAQIAHKLSGNGKNPVSSQEAAKFFKINKQQTKTAGLGKIDEMLNERIAEENITRQQAGRPPLSEKDTNYIRDKAYAEVKKIREGLVEAYYKEHPHKLRPGHVIIIDLEGNAHQTTEENAALRPAGWKRG